MILGSRLFELLLAILRLRCLLSIETLNKNPGYEPGDIFTSFTLSWKRSLHSILCDPCMMRQSLFRNEFFSVFTQLKKRSRYILEFFFNLSHSQYLKQTQTTSEITARRREIISNRQKHRKWGDMLKTAQIFSCRIVASQLHLNIYLGRPRGVDKEWSGRHEQS